MSVLKICLYAGLLCSFPLILFFIGEFVIPGLNEKEKKLILPVVAFSFFLFATGVLLSISRGASANPPRRSRRGTPWPASIRSPC